MNTNTGRKGETQLLFYANVSCVKSITFEDVVEVKLSLHRRYLSLVVGVIIQLFSPHRPEFLIGPVFQELLRIHVACNSGQLRLEHHLLRGVLRSEEVPGQGERRPERAGHGPQPVKGRSAKKQIKIMDYINSFKVLMLTFHTYH